MPVLVPADEHAGGATWHRWDGDTALMSVWTEKVPGHGEDAEPLVLRHRGTPATLLGVFDGAGGAGAGEHEGRSGAWFAARLARDTTEKWYLAGHRDVAEPACAALRATLAERFGALHVPGRRGKIIGSMRREFPTTLAVLDQRHDESGLAWRAFWAGDSRCYLLSPVHGVQQLTVDDTDCLDALDALVQDPPMTNVVCADRPFRINAATGHAALPCVLICATDGFFGYVHTPAGFEHMVLAELDAAANLGQWARGLAETVSATSADDASLSVAAFGFGGFAGLQGAFRERLRHVAEEHWAPVEDTVEGDRATYVAARADSWARYRAGYEHLLPHNATGGAR